MAFEPGVTVFAFLSDFLLAGVEFLFLFAMAAELLAPIGTLFLFELLALEAPSNASKTFFLSRLRTFIRSPMVLLSSKDLRLVVGVKMAPGDALTREVFARLLRRGVRLIDDTSVLLLSISRSIGEIATIDKGGSERDTPELDTQLLTRQKARRGSEHTNCVVILYDIQLVCNNRYVRQWGQSKQCARPGVRRGAADNYSAMAGRTRVYLLRSLPKRWASPTGLQYPPLYSKCIIITLPSGLAFIF